MTKKTIKQFRSFTFYALPIAIVSMFWLNMNMHLNNAKELKRRAIWIDQIQEFVENSTADRWTFSDQIQFANELAINNPEFVIPKPRRVQSKANIPKPLKEN